MDFYDSFILISFLGDELAEAPRVKKVIITSGKHYYGLDQERRDKQIRDVAILRLESLCPFPLVHLQAELEKYKNAKSKHNLKSLWISKWKLTFQMLPYQQLVRKLIGIFSWLFRQAYISNIFVVHTVNILSDLLNFTECAVMFLDNFDIHRVTNHTLMFPNEYWITNFCRFLFIKGID